MILKNPVLRGFYPDPSICRAGDTYYMTCSTLEYYPGYPLFCSKDLQHWKQVGYALGFGNWTKEMVNGQKYELYAPTLRYHENLFYLISTNILGGGHFIITSENIEGPWSEPIWIEGDDKGDGHDPDLFFDSDGQVYFSRFTWNKGIMQWKLDMKTKKVISEGKTIWEGFEDRYCECPHIYKINGWYYLLAAEGSTGVGHMIVCARSRFPDGPYEGCPANPIFTHRALVMEEIRCVGHGDLVLGPDEKWWMVVLGTRQNAAGRLRVLGRETFLVPVDWSDSGWPVVNENQPLRTNMECKRELPSITMEEELLSDDFNQKELGVAWSFHYPPKTQFWSLEEQPGHLVLYGSKETLDEDTAISLIVRRQQEIHFTASALIRFMPEYNEEAGITAYASGFHHYEIGIRNKENKNWIFWRKRIGDLVHTEYVEEADQEALELILRGDREYYTLGYRKKREGAIRWCAKGMAKYLATEIVGSSDGVFLGMYATGNGRDSVTPAAFDWFQLESSEQAQKQKEWEVLDECNEK